MKLTTDIIDQLAEALMMKNKKGEEIWEDGDEIDVNVAGIFVFIPATLILAIAAIELVPSIIA